MRSMVQPPIGFAHRGARAHAPENTLAAIRLGQSLGYQAHEFDVKLSLDGVAVLIQDVQTHPLYAEVRKSWLAEGRRVPIRSVIALPFTLDRLQAGITVDLVFSDILMPGGMNGRQLAETARTLRPGISVLFLTGYAHNAALGDEPLSPRTQVLSKPFNSRALLAKIGAMLESRE